MLPMSSLELIKIGNKSIRHKIETLLCSQWDKTQEDEAVWSHLQNEGTLDTVK